MDPFELLKKDHEKVSELFERIESASGKAKLGVFRQIKSELDLHTHIEETIFYPALEKASETRDLTLEAYEEHKVVKDLLSELDGAHTPTDEWQVRITVLRENVEHHVKEEENELFDKANDVLTNDEAERLGDRMRAEKVKKGAPAPETTEEPGLIRTIAKALGFGQSSAKSSEKAEKKGGKAAKKKAKPSSVTTAKKRSDALKPSKASPVKKSNKSASTKKTTSKKAAAKKAAKKSASSKKKGRKK